MPSGLAVSSLFLAVVLTGLTVTATQVDFGNGSWMRVFVCIDAPGNDLTTTREVPISVHLRRPVPAGRGSVAKVLPLLLLLTWLNADG